MTNDEVIGEMIDNEHDGLQVIIARGEVHLAFREECYGVEMSANEARQLAAWLVRGAAKIEWEAENWKAHLEKEGVR